MNPTLKSRIARIVSPNVVEFDLKRRAKFGKLNIAPTFDLVAHLSASEDRGDIRKQFARMASARGML